MASSSTYYRNYNHSRKSRSYSVKFGELLIILLAVLKFLELISATYKPLIPHTNASTPLHFEQSYSYHDLEL